MYTIRLENRNDFSHAASLSVNADLRTLRDICGPLSELYLVRVFWHDVALTRLDLETGDAVPEIKEPSDLTTAKRSELERYFRSISDLCHRAGSQIEFGAHMMDMMLGFMERLEKMQADSDALLAGFTGVTFMDRLKNLREEHDRIGHRLKGLDK